MTLRPDSLIQTNAAPEVSISGSDTVTAVRLPAQAYVKAKAVVEAATDTVAIEIPAALPGDTVYGIDSSLEAAMSALYSTDGIDVCALTIAVPPPQPTWESGLEGSPRHTNAGDNSGVMAIITGMFLLMMMSYKYCRRLFSTLVSSLLGMRRRANVFDEHTSNETQVMGLMAMQWSVYTGLLMYSYFAWQNHLNVANTFTDTLSLIGLTACYYVFQLVAYAVVGYTFSTESGRRYFVQGFTASQSLLGFLLIVPALVAIFYPEAAPQMIAVSAVLYLLARIIFIVKGFRIFYHKFWSLLYFILYLCTLEIIPLVVLYNLALLLVNSDL